MEKETPCKEEVPLGVPECSYDPATGTLSVQRGGVYSFKFQPNLEEALFTDAVNFMRKVARDTGTTIFVVCEGHPTVMCTHVDMSLSYDCPKCSFQLTGPQRAGLPDHAECPECGEATVNNFTGSLLA